VRYLVFVCGLLFATLLQAQKAVPLRLKVFAYSINHGVSANGKTNLLRIVDLIKKHQPDLVALQAIDSGSVASGRLNQGRILALLTGYDYYFAPAHTYTTGGTTGVCVLSRHPIEAIQRLKLPNPDSTHGRVLMATLVKLPQNKYLRFCTTQLDDLSSMNRGLQAAVVNEALQYSIQPVLLVGDFNAPPVDHELEVMHKYWTDAGKGTDAYTYLPDEMRYDYAWTLPRLPLKLLDYTVLYEPTTSDHFPLLVTYELK
jgi:endonuclease/exonuclease/phosphatase family metal-dependent hydrolase